MQAIVFNYTGPANSVLKLQELPTPKPDNGQVLIRTVASPIQPADFLFIEGNYRISPVFPQPAGLEGFGEVISVGEGVSKKKIGEFVAFRAPGAWAEYVVASENRIYRAPDSLLPEIACQFALNPLTAWGLLDHASLVTNDRLLLTAGKSIVASILAKLALGRGIHPFLLFREDDGYRVQNLMEGSETGRHETIAEALQETQMHPFDAIIDAVGGVNTPELMDVIKPGGKMISYGILDPSEMSIAASKIIFKNLTWIGFGVDQWLSHASALTIDSAQLDIWQLLKTSPEVLPVKDLFDRKDFLEAIAFTHDRSTHGKVILMANKH
ncbi:hypothetical protein C9J12_28960 [Photobacterium frigidiphilum]|uniref:Enoyl reductase (ER) domain-containing protein n=1 Tax=Photobacterium frigidiphilum TaxID=264736 RepID=A0A2T3J611_9GAMM|nr:alcohol dehydrogenase catalytic domain-containing protein [Photobacterium frigidiphilum]PSU42449.1 hypothetical protein C9J12_28960 [Photobacterium frigidiphilum]